MLLIHEKKQGHGKWEVAWMWLPYFLASNTELVKYVDNGLNHSFKGTTLDLEEDQTQLLEQMNRKVIDLILEKYQIKGMREYLEATSNLSPEEEEEP
jgi:hypothetical protein